MAKNMRKDKVPNVVPNAIATCVVVVDWVGGPSVEESPPTRDEGMAVGDTTVVVLDSICWVTLFVSQIMTPVRSEFKNNSYTHMNDPTFRVLLPLTGRSCRMC